MMIITASLLIVSAVSMTPEGVSAYEKNEAASQANACGNNFIPINIGCQNTDSQIQGDENAAASTSQHTFPEMELVQQEPPKTPQPPIPLGEATLNVIKEVICPEGFVCPLPDDFTISVLGNNPDPGTFAGSAVATTVKIQPGMYETTETQHDIQDGLIALPPAFSEGCTGNIQRGQEITTLP